MQQLAKHIGRFLKFCQENKAHPSEGIPLPPAQDEDYFFE
jgi:hypothetical protein